MTRLEDVCEFIVDCPHSTAKDEGQGYPLIRTPNIGKGRLLLDDVHRVSEEVYNKRNQRAVPQDGDLIFAREAPAGNVAIVKNGEKVCLGQRTVLLRPNKEIVNPVFLTYYLLAPEQQYGLLGTANGATVAHVNIPAIRGLKVDLPSLEKQNRIAGVIVAYDDLIENNQKQIKLLEEAAQRLYKEWFVDLHFPGWETTPIIDGIPEGWTELSMADVCDTVGGGTPSTKVEAYYCGGKIKWVTPTDITRKNSLILLDSEKKITEDGLKYSSAKIVPPYTILMTSRASIGYFGLCEHEVCTNQGFISCIPNKENYRYFLLYNLMNRVEEIRSKASGSTFLEISKKAFREFVIILPSNNVLDDFAKMINPVIRHMEALTKSIAQLQEARDRLLPKLMNGEIEV